MLLQYIKENNLELVDSYVDDGVSGTTFDRPEFKRLIKDIEDKKINMVITKDLSRLGRDYIETGKYIEKFFPSYNVRYIAILDNIDTYLDNVSNDIMPFKAIMNDMYAKDISKKIRASLRAKKKEGKWVSGRCSYGYDIDPNNKNRLIINKEQARNVKYIYDLAVLNYSCYKIAKILTDKNIKTPSEYYNGCYKNNYGIWNSRSVKDILTNEIYLGNLIQNKRSKVNYKIKKMVYNKKDDYIVCTNTHTPIIDINTFKLVQDILPKNTIRFDKREFHLLDGLLFCGNCKYRLSILARRKKDNNCYTICNNYRRGLCSCHSNNYDKLEGLILDNIKDIIVSYMNEFNIDNILNKIKKDKCNSDIIDIEKEINRVLHNLDSIYIDKINNDISIDMYNRVKSKLESDLDELNSKYERLKYIDVGSNYKWSNFIDINKLDRSLIIKLVNKIEVYDDKRVYIFLNFRRPLVSCLINKN